MKKQDWEMPTDVLAVHSEIETWRKRREKRGPIPSSIWLAASSLAGQYGVHRIARALRLNYGALKYRLESGKTEAETRSPKERPDTQGVEFVELTGMSCVEGSRARVERCRNEAGFQLEIEVSNGHGSQMTVRVSEGAGVDVGQIIRGFCGER